MTDDDPYFDSIAIRITSLGGRIILAGPFSFNQVPFGGGMVRVVIYADNTGSTDCACELIVHVDHIEQRGSDPEYIRMDVTGDDENANRWYYLRQTGREYIGEIHGMSTP